jgi:acyl-CoA thioesterase I
LLIAAFSSTQVAAAPPTLVVLGSSSAAGIGASNPSLSWVGRLRSWLHQTEGTTLENVAVPGALTSSALCTKNSTTTQKNVQTPAANTMDHAVATGTKRIILAFPSNDAVAGLSATDTLANIQQMVTCAQAAGAKVAIMSSLPRSGLTQDQRLTIKTVDTELQKLYRSCFVDVHDALTNEATLNVRTEYSAGDGIHFNDTGHAVIFRRVRLLMESRQCL